MLIFGLLVKIELWGWSLRTFWFVNFDQQEKRWRVHYQKRTKLGPPWVDMGIAQFEICLGRLEKKRRECVKMGFPKLRLTCMHNM